MWTDRKAYVDLRIKITRSDDTSNNDSLYTDKRDTRAEINK